jgi:hypothetical protein
MVGHVWLGLEVHCSPACSASVTCEQLYCHSSLTSLHGAVHFKAKERNLEESIRKRQIDRLCGLVVRVPGYKSRDRGFDSQRYQIF